MAGTMTPTQPLEQANRNRIDRKTGEGCFHAGGGFRIRGLEIAHTGCRALSKNATSSRLTSSGWVWGP